ncbi:MAG: hypothetical protein HC831_08895 [Chloroflexia bacterium]|nr:hypothetical protein [Chloroflexia bacterium]
MYVCFKNIKGHWTEPINLGINTEFTETCPSLSPDGNYIFSVDTTKKEVFQIFIGLTPKSLKNLNLQMFLKFLLREANKFLYLNKLIILSLEMLTMMVI